MNDHSDKAAAGISVSKRPAEFRSVASEIMGLANAGINQLQRVLEESKDIGDTALTLEIRIHLGRVLLEFANSEEDKQEGLKLLESSLESARENKLAVQVHIAEEILNHL